MDIDLAIELPKFFMFDKERGTITVYLEDENLPAFCSFCNRVGHALVNCRCLEYINKRDFSIDDEKATRDDISCQIYVPKISGVGTQRHSNDVLAAAPN